MNILFDLGHPAHFHLFKNFIKYLKKNNHNIVITTRTKDVIHELLKREGFEYTVLSSPKVNLIGMFAELIIRDLKLFKMYLKYKFDAMFGSSINITHLSSLTKAKSYFFAEDDDDIVPLSRKAMSGSVTKIINPENTRIIKWHSKRVYHNSYHELAYLHPKNFSPNPDTLKKYNLIEKKYIIIRLSALKAHHDVGAKGISTELYLKIKEILKDYTIIESKENSKTHQIEPWDMHHVLAYAKMIISDSQTMTIEAAVLGVPAVRINTFIGKSTVIEELEQGKYKLAYGFYPHQEKESLETIKYLAENSEVDKIWQERRQVMLADKCDLNQWMIDYFEKEINK
jgi:predicted glycosyltransferase